MGVSAAALGGPPVLARLARGHERERALAALVEAVGTASDSRVDPRDARGAARRLMAERAGALPVRRAAIDDVIAALVAERFADRPVAARVRMLRAWATGAGERRALAARAVGLAASAFGPDGEEFRLAPVVI